MARKKFYGDTKNKGTMLGSGSVMPQEAIMKEWPKAQYGSGDFSWMDDTITGIDEQMKNDSYGENWKKGSKVEKY